MVYWQVVWKAATKVFCVADAKVVTKEKSLAVLLEPYEVVKTVSWLDEGAAE